MSNASINYNTIPDVLYGDLYCKICDSHMNSEDQWEKHIRGKKHLKNFKKGNPGTKYKDLNVKSDIEYELKDVKQAVVGLSFIYEIWRHESGVPVIYCCLCYSIIPTCKHVVEHVISTRHRLNYIKHVKPDLLCADLEKVPLELLVLETAAKLELDYGRGNVKVKQAKADIGNGINKRSLDSGANYTELEKQTKIQKTATSENLYVWKSLNVPKNKKENFYRRETLDKTVNSCSENDHAPKSDLYKRSDYSSESNCRQHAVDRLKYHRVSPQHYNYDSRKDDYLCKTRSSQYYEDKCPGHLSENEGSYDASLPMQIKKMNRDVTSNIYKEFKQRLNDLPAELFFKLILQKLELLEKSDFQDLRLVPKVISKLQNMMHHQLPPEDKAMLKEKMKISDNLVELKDTATSSILATNRNFGLNNLCYSLNEQYKQDLNEIDNLIYVARRQSSIASNSPAQSYTASNSPAQSCTASNSPAQSSAASDSPVQSSAYQINYLAYSNQPDNGTSGMTLIEKPYNEYSPQSTWLASKNNHPYDRYKC